MKPPVKSLAGALRLVRERGVLPFTDAGSGPSFVGAVTGGPVRGSWWGHPQGSLIFNLAAELEDTGEVLSVKLVAGKIALVHASLWPALVRVVTDETWRSERSSALTQAARRLQAAVTKAGRLRQDELEERFGADGKPERRALAKAREELEKKLLIHVGSVHTEHGRHATVLTAWETWATPAVLRAAKKLAFADALAHVLAACAGFKTGLEAPRAPRAPAR